jgi:uncharacterized protein (DUF302 family)
METFMTTEPTLQTIPAHGRVDEIVMRVEHALADAGMKIFARIDHAAEAHAAGLAMRSTVVIVFGSPKGGTPLMVARPTVAIDLPLKALIWEDESGTTWLTYNMPALLDRHGLDRALAERLAPAGALLERAAVG